MFYLVSTRVAEAGAGGREAQDGGGPAQEPQHARQDSHPLLQLVRQRLRLLRPDPEHGPGEL